MSHACGYCDFSQALYSVCMYVCARCVQRCRARIIVVCYCAHAVHVSRVVRGIRSGGNYSGRPEICIAEQKYCCENDGDASFGKKNDDGTDMFLKCTAATAGFTAEKTFFVNNNKVYFIAICNSQIFY